MIEIDIILGSKYESPWSEELICTSGAQVSIVAKSVLGKCRLVNSIKVWMYNLVMVVRISK